MKSMVYYELKKILHRRFSFAMMIAGYILIITCAVVQTRALYFYDVDTQKYIYGIQAYKMEAAKNNALTDYLTEEYMTDFVADIQNRRKELNLTPDEAYAETIRPFNDLVYVILSNYTDLYDDNYIKWEMIDEIPTEGGIDFYQRRIDKVRNYLNMDFSYGNYSEEEKTYWLEKERTIQTPFKWGDKDAMELIWTIIQLSFYLVFVIAVCIAPIFADEYESGAAALLLTTRFGKSRLIAAKIITAVMFAISYLTIGIAIGIIIVGVSIGFPGADLPLQLWGTVIPYGWSIGQTCVISFMISLLVTIAITSLTMLMSSRIKTSIATIVLDFALLIGPAFLPMSKTYGLWNHINYLFPVRVMLTKDMLSTFNSYQLGTVVISYLGMGIIVYTTVSIISLFCLKNGFAKHQVK